MASADTFRVEMEAIGSIPGVLYEQEWEYTPYHGIPFEPLNRIARHESLFLDTDVRVTQSREYQYIPDTPHAFVEGLGRLYTASQASDDAFAEAIYDLTGVDAEAVLTTYTQNRGGYVDLAAIKARFGTDAFATYLPWHVYARSTKTPWGMYLFFDLLVEWTVDIFLHSRALPTPKPSLLTLFSLLFHAAYRHELFHYHVERFALRQEVMWHRPIYRPYKDDVVRSVCNSPEWLEEALAQAVVLESRLLINRAHLDKSIVKRILIPEFDQFPDGYRHYRCDKFGGTQAAHRWLSSQILLHQVNPPYLVTDLALSKSEYSASAVEVPGYWAWTPTVYSRFQLATPKVRAFEKYAGRHGIAYVGPGPGDHKVYKVKEHRVHVNVKNGHLDLASLKAIAKAAGISTFQMAQKMKTD